MDIESKISTGSYMYSYIFIDERPSLWMPAKTANGKILNDQYLDRALVDTSNPFSVAVNLVFKDEGKAMFGELTKRLIGKRIAIFV